jgi:hypothetical protein
MVSDNGSQYTSQKFDHYCKSHGIKNRTVSPWHPRSNGMAERAIQTSKDSIAKLMHDGFDL